MAGLDRGTLLALGAMAMAVFVIANDFTAMSVALPNIENDFNVDVSSVQWVINIYALVFGVMIVTGGRLADMFGRRRLFFIGAAIFAGFSVLGGAAQNELWLIACRALMGIGGAMMWPAVLGMTFAILPEEKAGLAGGLILGAAGFGNAAGPLIGGALTEAFSWRWILFLNLPIAVIACAVTWRAVPESRADTGRERIDYAGITDPRHRADVPSDRARPGHALGLGRPAHRWPVRALRRLARRLRGCGAAGRLERAGPRATCSATRASAPRASRRCSCPRCSSP